MDKRHLHHTWTKFRSIKPAYFLAATVVCGCVSVYALRNNYEHMVNLRQAVYVADKNNGDTQAALEKLRAYVYAHMNTDLSGGNSGVYPPIQLKYTYDRLVRERGNNATDTNSQIYTDAQKYCENKIPTGFSGRYRLQCIQDYISSHTLAATAPIPDSLYKFDFVSPWWSPDLAGWSLLATLLSALLLVISFALNRWFKTHVA